MRNEIWVTLARYMPPSVQERLMLVTSSGTEMAIQSFLRIERDFVAIKGRLSGSQETGRVFFVPWDQIDYMGFMNPLKDSEFEELFGGLTFPELPEEPVAPPPPLAAAPPPPPTGVVEASMAPVAPSNGARPPSYSTLPRIDGSGPRPTIKSAVLERFRARNGNSGGPPSPGNETS